MEDLFNRQPIRACDLLVGDLAIYTFPDSGEQVTFEVKRLWPTKATGLVCFETTDGQIIQAAAGLAVDKMVFSNA